jgi:hypothetical protein
LRKSFLFPVKKADLRTPGSWIAGIIHAFRNEKLIKKINEYEKELTDFDDGAF